MSDKMSDVPFIEKTNSITNFLHSEWMKMLLEDCENEALEASHIKLLQECGRDLLWNISTFLNVQSTGVPGRACQILERYLHTFSTSNAQIEDQATRKFNEYVVRNRIILVITCSILLASKMESATRYTNAKIVQVILMCRGITLTVAEINATERAIYRALEYKMPIWNSVDIALYLGFTAKLDRNKLRGVTLIVDLAEYFKVGIENQVRHTTRIPPEYRKNGVSNVRTLHLAAGAVAVAIRLSQLPDISSELATLIKVPEVYLRCLTDIILRQICRPNRAHKITPAILKRKRILISICWLH